MAKFRERELENIKNTIVGNTCQKFTIPLILFTYTIVCYCISHTYLPCNII